MHTTIRQKYMVLFHLIFLLYMTIRPKIRLLIDLCLLCPRNPLIEIYGPFSFIISFVHSRSNKTYGPHWFIYFTCTQPLDKNICSSFIYSFFSARPFDQNWGPQWFISFICTWPFDQNLGSSLIYSFFSERPFDQNLASPLIYLFHFQTNIQKKYEIFFHFFFLCARPFDQKLGSSLI